MTKLDWLQKKKKSVVLSWNFAYVWPVQLPDINNWFKHYNTILWLSFLALYSIEVWARESADSPRGWWVSDRNAGFSKAPYTEPWETRGRKTEWHVGLAVLLAPGICCYFQVHNAHYSCTYTCIIAHKQTKTIVHAINNNTPCASRNHMEYLSQNRAINQWIFITELSNAWHQQLEKSFQNPGTWKERWTGPDPQIDRLC